jgi:hypothetical protein
MSGGRPKFLNCTKKSIKDSLRCYQFCIQPQLAVMKTGADSLTGVRGGGRLELNTEGRGTDPFLSGYSRFLPKKMPGVCYSITKVILVNSP